MVCKHCIEINPPNQHLTKHDPHDCPRCIFTPSYQFTETVFTSVLHNAIQDP